MNGQAHVYIKIYGMDFTSYRRYLMHKRKSNAAGFVLFKSLCGSVSCLIVP